MMQMMTVEFEFQFVFCCLIILLLGLQSFFFVVIDNLQFDFLFMNERETGIERENE